MLLRNRTLNHNGTKSVDLPLLVPSFSSKGFSFFNKGRGKTKKKYSETSYAIDQLVPFIEESLLISAYDLHHNFYENPKTCFSGGRLIFLDSGGYELTPEFDSTEPKKVEHSILDFSLEDYKGVLNKTKKSYKKNPIIISSFDWETKGRPFDEQVKKARKLFSEFPDFLSNFILKPHSPVSRTINIDTLIPHINELTYFDIIGVTEKELGPSLIDRLKAIARLRKELNEHKVNSPIHIWGGLDPVVTPLYFFAGADIFDGISWMRYMYHDGLAVNRQCYSILEKEITTIDKHSYVLSMNKNLMELRRLSTNLKAFFDSDAQRFDVFEHNKEIFQSAYKTMLTKIPYLK